MLLLKKTNENFQEILSRIGAEIKGSLRGKLSCLKPFPFFNHGLVPIYRGLVHEEFLTESTTAAEDSDDAPGKPTLLPGDIQTGGRSAKRTGCRNIMRHNRFVWVH